MSLVTNFNFREFECDATRSGLHSVKTDVSMSIMTSEDMRRLAVVRVQVPCGSEITATPWMMLDERATFWDTRMGNFELRRFPSLRCATCAALTINHRCSGHFGYISMPEVSPDGDTLVVYNPLMFRDTCRLLRAQCFWCRKFRAPPLETTRWYLALELFDRGLVASAMNFLQRYRGGKAAALRRTPRTEGERQTKTHRQEEPCDDIDDMKRFVAHEIRAAHASGLLESGRERRESLGAVVDLRNQLVSDALAELQNFSTKCVHCGVESPLFTEKDGQLYCKLTKAAMDRNVKSGLMTSEARDACLTEMRVFSRERVLFPATQALDHIVCLCESYTDLLGKLLYNVGSATVDVPCRNPLAPEELYKALFLDCILVPPLNIRLASGVDVKDGPVLLPDERTKLLSHVLQHVLEIEKYYKLPEKTAQQLLVLETNVRGLQLLVNKSYDVVLASFAKKEGLFRMNMMGKRVNQACRSVISPDFTVEPNEVLLPRAFARNLSFPEQLNLRDPSRTALLRKCIINGSIKYPGATHIEYRQRDGSVRTVPLTDGSLDEQGRTAKADAAFESAQRGQKVVVYRHVLDGDRIVFNRQPTLHRPSMQSYEAKVLSNLKTLRFHYVNGKSYNADFDGDEMNVHVPQSLETRAELAMVMDANLCYIVPTSVKPIRGLIQDHVAAGVFLTIKDRFFDHGAFVQLIFQGLQPYLGRSGITRDLSSLIPIPAVMKPRPLWTGKQVITVVLRLVSDVSAGQNVGVTLRGSSAVYTTNWTTRDGSTVASHEMADEPLYVLRSELLIGVMDKNQLGPTPNSIAHAIYDLYGPHHVGRFFGALGRILTYSLRYRGFSIGLEDMMLNADEARRKAMHQIDICTLNATDEAQALAAVNKASSALNSKFIPRCLRRGFPDNDLITMTASGAKGSNINAIQMALTLGQQTFSGRRISVMSSGKTAPSFFKGDMRARSFGFAMGRFLTGVRPAEYTIHAMAGRDGLIDTGIKTANSGYLQRCLIKGLESLTTQWDGTVRDANGAVIQFAYGGDGLDPCKAGTIAELQMVRLNLNDFVKRYIPQSDRFDSDAEETDAAMSAEAWRKQQAEAEGDAPLPGHLSKLLENTRFESNKNIPTLQRWNDRNCLAEKLEEEQNILSSKVTYITNARLHRAKAAPGEPVGIIAAQSAGEPSTQMTLNTFHQAGQTVTHVTEGIPRLRELLMFASVAKAAVIVPIHDTTHGELDAVQSIIGLLTPKLLKDALAPVSTPYRWSIRRGHDRATLSIVMLFRVAKLDQLLSASQECSVEEKVACFAAGLRAFSKQLCMELRGDVKAAGLCRTAVTDPAELPMFRDEEDEVPLAEDNDDSGEEDPPNVDAEDDREDRENVVGAVDRTPSEVPNDEVADSDNEVQLEGTAATDIDPRCAYGRFRPMDDFFLSSTVRSIIEPLSLSEVMTSVGTQNAALLDGLCAAKFTITLPPRVVRVIPDAINSCLETVTLPVTGPQIEESKWIPDRGKSCGQLIMQGAGAKLRTALRAVAPHAERYPGIDINRIVSTDVRDVCETYGVEAAYQFLTNELIKLFKRHSVDARHCSLIADAATVRGTWQAFNFNGMIAHSASPLFQMTFASSRKFLERAISRGIPDHLDSFSASIMVGERPKVGTGTVSVSLDPQVVKETIAERRSDSIGLRPMRSAAHLPT